MPRRRRITQKTTGRPIVAILYGSSRRAAASQRNRRLPKLNGNRLAPVADAPLQKLLFRWLVRRESSMRSFEVSSEWTALRDEFERRIERDAPQANKSRVRSTVDALLRDLNLNHEEYEIGGRSGFLVELIDSTVEALTAQSLA